MKRCPNANPQKPVRAQPPLGLGYSYIPAVPLIRFSQACCLGNFEPVCVVTCLTVNGKDPQQVAAEQAAEQAAE
jgi:hypothetical protein